MLEAYGLLHKRLYPIYKDALLEETRCDDMVCEASGRFPNEWHESPRGYYSNKQQTLVQSEVCKILSLRNNEIVGSATANSAQSLIGFMSCFIIVPVDENQKVELWVSGKSLDRMSPTTPFTLKPYGGNRAKLALLEDVKAALVIDSSMRKEIWLKTMLVGNESNLLLSSESGSINVPRTNWPKFKKAFLAINKSVDQNLAKTILRGVTNGRMNINDKRVQDFFGEHAEFVKACQMYLPEDPYAKLFYIDALGGI